MPLSSTFRFYPCGDHAVTLSLGDKVDAAVNGELMSLFTYLSNKKIDGVRDIIPAYHTLTVVYDILAVRRAKPAVPAYTAVCQWLNESIASFENNAGKTTRQVRIPVCYDVSLGPDLLALAEAHHITADEVIRLHTSVSYRVYMIGFLPGFAYMGTVDKRIATPRKSQPRTLVPHGSVGIAGEQTGIYPFDSPGGWQLIGQTPLQMFDVSSRVPCYLQPGDDVIFYPITIEEFFKMKHP